MVTAYDERVALTAGESLSSDPGRSRWLGRIVVANLVAQILIVVTGGLVRLTGSGLGCSTWPQCEPGSYTPTFRPEDGIHPYIEFGNRLIGIVVGVIALALVYAVWRWMREGPRRPMLWLSFGVVVGTIAQGVLGGITVAMALHPGTVMAHFLISVVLVVLSTLVLRLLLDSRAQSSVSDGGVPAMLRAVGGLTGALGATVIVLGTVVTGSGPHSGDADQPARFGFDPRTVSWLHADAVMLFVGLVVAMVLATSVLASTRYLRRPWRLVLTVSLFQGALGYAQYLTGVPVPLVSLHMLGACLLASALTWAVYAVLLTASRSSGPAETSVQREEEQRVDRDREEDQRQIADREMEQAHRAQR
ncbi:MAG: COX15/CtaA family protein [Ornithinimicrobium sp.]